MITGSTRRSNSNKWREAYSHDPARMQRSPRTQRPPLGGLFVWLDSFDTAVPQGMALVCKQRYASEAMSMSDQDDWEFAGPDDQIGDPRRGGVFAERCDRRRPR